MEKSECLETTTTEPIVTTAPIDPETTAAPTTTKSTTKSTTVVTTTPKTTTASTTTKTTTTTAPTTESTTKSATSIPAEETTMPDVTTAKSTTMKTSTTKETTTKSPTTAKETTTKSTSTTKETTNKSTTTTKETTQKSTTINESTTVKTTTTTKSPTHHKYYIVDEIEVPSGDASSDKILADLSTVICTDSQPDWDDCKVKPIASKRDPVNFLFQTDVTTIYDKSTTKNQYNSKFESADETQLEIFDKSIKDHRFTGEICEMIDGSDDCKEIIEEDLNVGLIVGMTFFGLFIVLGTWMDLFSNCRFK